ncbi:MAG: NIPSNAP family protein [Bacteroidales bacterium]
MKQSVIVCSVLLIMILTSCNRPRQPEIYQLKTYILENSQQESVVDNYLETAYLPALHRAGIEKAGVFKPIDRKSDSNNYIMVFIPFSSTVQFEELPDILDLDEAYLSAGKEYLEAPHDQPPYVRIESVLLRAFSGFAEFREPDLASPVTDRVYELRSYESATERIHQRKVEMFNEGESDLFVELGFEPMFFGEVISGGQMPNLIYMTCHEDEYTQSENWNSFGEHPDWIAMKRLERYRNTVSHIDKYLLHPTPYSDL